jgi:hypothetical protein
LDLPYNTIPNYTFKAITTIVGVDNNGYITPIVTFTWGYTLTNGIGSINGSSVIITPISFENQNIIDMYNIRPPVPSTFFVPKPK